MPEEPLESILAGVDDIFLSRERVERCTDLAEATALPRDPDLAGALQWEIMRGQLAAVFQGPSIRVGDLRLPAEVAPGVADRCAEILAGAVAAEMLPVRASRAEGMGDRLRRHAALVARLTDVFRERFAVPFG